MSELRVNSGTAKRTSGIDVIECYRRTAEYLDLKGPWLPVCRFADRTRDSVLRGRAARGLASYRRFGLLLPDHEARANLPAGIGFVLCFAASFWRRSFSALWAV